MNYSVFDHWYQLNNAVHVIESIDAIVRPALLLLLEPLQFCQYSLSYKPYIRLLWAQSLAVREFKHWPSIRIPGYWISVSNR